MNVFELMATLGLDSSAYDSGLQQALSSAEGFGGELENGVGSSAEAAEDALSSSAEGMADSIEGASDSISSSSDSISDSAESFADAVTAGADDAASAMDGMAGDVDSAADSFSSAMDGVGGSMDATADGIEEGSESGVSALFDLAGQAGEMGGVFSALGGQAQALGGKLLTALKTPVGAATALAAAIAALTTAIIKGVNATAEYGDHVDKMSQKIGLSAESYQKWDYVMQLAGTDVDNLKMGLKTLSKQAESNSDAFQELGISQEEVASLSKEDLYERTIKALANMEDGTKRSALASQLLGRAGADMAPLLNQGSEAIEEQMKTAEEYGMIMSDESVKAAAAFEDSGTTLKMTLQGVRNNMMDDFLPAMTDVKNGLAAVFAGDSSGAVQMAQGIGNFILQGIKLIPTVIWNFLKGFGQAALAIIQALGQALIEHVPDLFNKLIEFLDNAITNLSEWSPDESSTDGAGNTILTKIGEAIVKYAPLIGKAMGRVGLAILKALGTLALKLLQLGGTLMLRLLAGLGKGAIKLLTWMGQLPLKLVRKITSKLTQFFNAGVSIVKHIISGIANWASHLPEKIKEMAKKALQKFKDMDWVQAGIDAVKGIIQGVGNWAGQLFTKFTNLGKDALAKFKKKLGISSPSKAFAEAAKWIPIGAALGIEQNAGTFFDAIDNLANTAVSMFDDEIGDVAIEGGEMGGLSDYSDTLTYKLSDDGEDTFATAVSNAVAQLIPALQEGMANAVDGMGISVDKYTYGKVVRKAAQGVL